MTGGARFIGSRLVGEARTYLADGWTGWADRLRGQIATDRPDRAALERERRGWTL